MKSSSRARSYQQCFLCREWSWSVCGSTPGVIGVELCLPCYVDVLEVRQARGLMAEPRKDFGKNDPRLEANTAGQSPSSFPQLDLFES